MTVWFYTGGGIKRRQLTVRGRPRYLMKIVEPGMQLAIFTLWRGRYASSYEQVPVHGVPLRF